MIIQKIYEIFVHKGSSQTVNKVILKFFPHSLLLKNKLLMIIFDNHILINHAKIEQFGIIVHEIGMLILIFLEKFYKEKTLHT